jgi:hypothetical protein
VETAEVVMKEAAVLVEGIILVDEGETMVEVMAVAVEMKATDKTEEEEIMVVIIEVVVIVAVIVAVIEAAVTGETGRIMAVIEVVVTGETEEIMAVIEVVVTGETEEIVGVVEIGTVEEAVEVIGMAIQVILASIHSTLVPGEAHPSIRVFAAARMLVCSAV